MSFRSPRVFLFLICALFAGARAQATTVIPPTFDSLVTSAHVIFVGQVIDVRSEWIATRTGRAIITKVTFKVEDVWKGSVGAITQLDFMGGTVGETTMEVVGIPQFTDGQRSVLFVSGQAKAVSPLVGFFHGRMPVERDASGTDRVRTYDGRALVSPDQVGGKSTTSAATATAMPLSDLASAVRGKVAAGERR